MVPLQGLTLEHDRYDHRKYCQRNNFLDHFQLHEVERTSVAVEADAVGRYLSYVFKECYAPVV